MSENSNRIKNKIQTIFRRYVQGRASADEKRFVENFYRQVGEQRGDEEVDFDRLELEIKESINTQIAKKGMLKKLIHNPYTRIAASLLIVSTITFLVFQMWKTENSSGRIQTAEFVGENPILSVGDETSYRFDENTQDSSSYRIIDDQKVFLLSETAEGIAEDAPRKITNPTKKVFTFLLDDGSQVWLNAHSSIEFMPSFNKTERVVYVSGEVSLAVTKREKDGQLLPFFVKTPLQTVEVLGTQFSVNTQEENEESVILLEGKIKLQHNVYKTSVILHPNQKAFLNSKDESILVASADENNKVRAWRKGLFYFEDESVEIVMKELAQWYNKSIHVDPAIKDIPITGMISRYEQLVEVLQIIEMTNNIKFEERKGAIYVTGND